MKTRKKRRLGIPAAVAPAVAAPVAAAPVAAVEPVDSRVAVSVPRAARMIGVSAKTLNKRCVAGEIPFINNGTETKARRAIPRRVIELVHRHGLRGVAIMMETGLS
jgi:hypothetical protein